MIYTTLQVGGSEIDLNFDLIAAIDVQPKQKNADGDLMDVQNVVIYHVGGLSPFYLTLSSDRVDRLREERAHHSRQPRLVRVVETVGESS